MKNKSEKNRILKSIKIDGPTEEDEYLASDINEDHELKKLVTERENQEEIEVDIDDL